MTSPESSRKSMSTPTRSTNRDDGFTLIEVIIAISLLLIASIAVAGFAVRGLQLSSHQQREQVAVTVATERMDQVQRLTTSRAELGSLISGREQSTVELAWSAAADVEGLEHTYPAWGTTVAGSPVIPVSSTVNRNGTDYESTVLIGTCYQPIAGGLCSLLPGTTDDPGPDAPGAADMTRMIRVASMVTYPGPCDDGTCTYNTLALFDTKGDLEWRAQ